MEAPIKIRNSDSFEVFPGSSHMMRLHGFEAEDENGNQYPDIYTGAINPTSTMRFHQQVNEFFEERDLENVNISSYFDKGHFDDPDMYQWVTESLTRQLNHQNYHHIVFIWDISDITMLSTNHIAELIILKPSINLMPLYNFRESICESVHSLQNSYNIIKDVVNIEDAFAGTTDQMRKAAPMYDALRKLYNNIQSDDEKEKKTIIQHELLVKCGMVEQEAELRQAAKENQKVYHKRWKYAKKCMELVNRRSSKSKTRKYENIVLCDEGVASGAAQLIISGISSTVPIENIYSPFCDPEDSVYDRTLSIKSVIDRIQRRYGEKCFLIHVTSGLSRAEIPIPIWPIRANEAFKFLYMAQRDFLLQEKACL